MDSKSEENINIFEHLAHGLLYNMHRSANDNSKRNYSDYEYSAVENTKPEPCVSLQSNQSQGSSLPSKLSLNSFVDFESVEVITADFDTLSRMSNSKYAGVVFTDIQESYPSDGEIDCRFYIVNKSIEPKPNDRIGVYKVCWKHTDEAIVWKNCSDSESSAHSPNELRLRFKLNEVVEKEKDGEFYQLCYVSEEGNVFGASTPFRIFRPNIDDLVEVNDKTSDDCDEFVVIRSEQALMHERLKQLITTNGLLDYNKRCIEQKLSAKEKELDALKADKLQTDHELQKLQSDLRECNERLSSLKDREAKQAEELELTTASLVKYRSLLRQKEAENASNIHLLESFKVESEHLCKKVLDVKNECNELKLENKRLKSQLEDTKELLKTRESNTAVLMEEITRLNQDKQKFDERINEIKSTLGSRTEAIKAVEDEWKQKETVWSDKEADLTKRIEEMTSRLTIAKTEYEEVFKQKTKLESKLSRFESKAEKYKMKRYSIEDSSQQQTGVKTLSVDSSESVIKPKEEEIVTLPCPMCKEEIVCTHSDVSPMNTHLEMIHSQLVCPVCSQLFDKNMEGIDRYFHVHVENHFDATETVVGADGEPLVMLP